MGGLAYERACNEPGFQPKPRTLQMVQAQMNKVTAWPIVETAVQPDLIGISLSTTLTFVSGATASQQAAAIANAQAAAENYINNLPTARPWSSTTSPTPS